MLKQSILIVAAGPLQMPLIEAARLRGLRIVAVDANPAAPGMRMANAAFAIPLDEYDAILDVAERQRVAAVASLCTDFAVRATAHVAERLHLPGLSVAAACNATDKRRMRRRFAIAGAPSAPFREVHDADSAVAAARELGYPVALKAPRSAGSRGVFRIGCDRQMRERFPDARSYEFTGALLVESWMEGPEVSVEGCCFEGEVHVAQITDKLVYRGDSPVEAGHTQGSRLSATAQRDIRICTAEGIRALEMDNCGFHAEIKVCSEGARIVEIAARLGGDRIATHLTPLSTGIDLVSAILDIALGKPPAMEPKWHRGSAIRYFDAGRCGVLASVSGLEDIPAMPGFELLVAGSDRGRPLQPGYPIPAIQSSLDRYGYAIFSGADATEAAARADRAAHLTFEFAS